MKIILSAAPIKNGFTAKHNYDTIIDTKEVPIMPTIMPIKDLRKTSEISDLAHRKKEPIFITKNGYSDLVVMSSELYEKLVGIYRVDQAIYEAEAEMRSGAEPISLDDAMERLNKKYYG